MRQPVRIAARRAPRVPAPMRIAVLVLAPLGIASLATDALADESRTMLIGPTTIIQPGHYVLAADIEAAVDPVILIQSDLVTLDLNGHAIRIPATTGVAVTIQENARSIRIRNGRISGGSSAVRHLASNPASETTVVLEDLEITDLQGAAILIQNARSVDVLRCAIRRTGQIGLFGGEGISLVAAPGGQVPPTGRVEYNDLREINGVGIAISGTFASLQVRRNTLVEIQDYRMTIAGGGVRVEGNTFIGNNGLGLFLNASGVDLVDNVFNGPCFMAQIYPDGSTPPLGSNRITGNVLIPNPACSGFDALGVFSSRNLIENNQIRGSAGCALRFGPAATSNSYRGNMLRMNAGGAVCNSGTGNTDDGSNIY